MARALNVHIGVLVTALTATTGVLVGAAPAAAIDIRLERSAAWAYVDSAQPNRVYVNGTGDAPVGTWRDAAGQRHTARSYFTFDISRYVGTVVTSAVLSGAETSVADCTQRPPIDLWHTKPVTNSSSWNRPPDDIAKVATQVRPAEAGCPAPYVEWDASKALKAAIADGKPTLTLSLRLPGQLERDPTQMRRYANQLALSISYNTPPDVPTDLQAGGKACTTHQPYAYVGRGDVRVEAAVSDADTAVEGHGDRLSAIFALWPVGRPQERIERESISEFQGRMWHEFPADTFADNTAYAWQVRASDSEATSKWSKVCYFRTDLLVPNPPSVTSLDYPDDSYPHGGIGIPGEFTFFGGDSDVVGFRYGFWNAETYVAAGTGRQVTVTLTPTQQIAPLVVQSIDRAGNASSETVYYVRANDTAPIVEGTLDAIGVPIPFTFRPGMPGVVEYHYRIGDQPEHTVAADTHGVANVDITTRSGGSLWLTVTSRTAAGVEASTELFFYLPSAPMVTSAQYPESEPAGGPGIEGEFVFTPRMPDVVRYIYSLSGAEEQTVDAAPDGTATITWTPTHAGPQWLDVRSVSADGTESEPTQYSIWVLDPLPRVSQSDQVPGQEGYFYFASQVPDVVAFVYRFDDGPEQVVQGNGSASITHTPEFGGPHTLTVRSRTSDGTLSAPRVHEFTVASAPTVTSAQYPSHTESGFPGQEGTFTFDAPLPDVVEYRYTIEEDLDPPVQTVAAGADGTATISWTPSRSGVRYMYVWAVTADGFTSDRREHVIVVGSPNPRIASTLYSSTPAGGVGVPGTFEFSSFVPVAEYEYWLNDDEPHLTVAAGADGTATVEIAPTRGLDNVLNVRSRTAGGTVSEITQLYFTVDTMPTISSSTYPYYENGGGPGVPGEFVLTSRMPGSVEFEYSFSGDPDWRRVPVGPDGRATITLTPPTEGGYSLAVHTVMADGTVSHEMYYVFYVSPAGG